MLHLSLNEWHLTLSIRWFKKSAREVWSKNIMSVVIIGLTKLINVVLRFWNEIGCIKGLVKGKKRVFVLFFSEPTISRQNLRKELWKKFRKLDNYLQKKQRGTFFGRNGGLNLCTILQTFPQKIVWEGKSMNNQ